MRHYTALLKLNGPILSFFLFTDALRACIGVSKLGLQVNGVIDINSIHCVQKKHSHIFFHISMNNV